MNESGIEWWLREDDEAELAALFGAADRVRRRSVGDGVHLRGLIEFSNVCERDCMYCGLRAANRTLPRYRMTEDEILACAIQAARHEYGTVVLQSGDDHAMPPEWFGDVIAAIKRRTPLAVAISVGERPLGHYAYWKRRGADRVLLKFETSDKHLFRRVHPPHRLLLPDRTGALTHLREMGYEIGSGIMVGLPGQTWESLAHDLVLFHELDLDMVAAGPYIPHPDTPMGRAFLSNPSRENWVPNTASVTRRVIALTRLLCPEANIPATSALAAVDRRGYAAGLNAGANVIMPNTTPPRYRCLYSIYPSRGRSSSADPFATAEKAIGLADRFPATGRGDRTRSISLVPERVVTGAVEGCL